MLKKYVKNHDELKRVVHLVAGGQLSCHYAAIMSGYCADYIRRMVKKFKIYGDSIFIHKLSGVKPVTTVPENIKRQITDLYLSEYKGFNFSFFYDCLKELTDFPYCYKTVCKILTNNGICSPETRKITRSELVHRPRRRAVSEGELLQADATPFQGFLWNGDTAYYALHGSIDDATGKITALYMCDNECYYGYTALLKLTNQKYKGFPAAFYTDRARIFFTPEQEKQKLSLEEQLNGVTKRQTQFQRMLSELRIKQILAHSPQAKGRVERMWKTIQGRLPWYFKHYKIKTIEEANIFLREKFIDIYNTRFAHMPEIELSLWHNTDKDLRYTCSYRISRHITNSGYFSFYNCHWKINRKHSAGINIELCITADSIKAYYDGQFYDVELLADSVDVEQTTAPRVLKNIIHDCMFSDAKQNCSVA